MKIETASKTAMVFGATGLIGSALLDLLLSDGSYDRVRVYARRDISVVHPKLKQYKIDFDKMDDFKHMFRGDDCFICLGTTMAKAGSKEAFYLVDYTYVHKIGAICSENGVNQLLVVTAMGADPDSLFYYNRVKGAIERDLKKLTFWSLRIFQPSLLLGAREERRIGESVAAVIGKGLRAITGDLLKKFNPIEGGKVAAAMVFAAKHLDGGTHTYTSDQIQDLAETYLGK